jgi:hypothetical protein
MSASPVSSPDTLSAERGILSKHQITLFRTGYPLQKGETYSYGVAIRDLCDSHEALRALLSERPTLSQADADALIDEFSTASMEVVLEVRGSPRHTEKAKKLQTVRAALRAALLGEKP